VVPERIAAELGFYSTNLGVLGTLVRSALCWHPLEPVPNQAVSKIQ